MRRSLGGASALVVVAGLVAVLVGVDPSGGGSVRAAGLPAKSQTWVNPRDGTVFLYVPAGPFLMGSDELNPATAGKPGWNPYLYPDSRPVQTVTLPGFWIARTEVTVGQYRKFLRATGRTAKPGTLTRNGSDDRLPVPVVCWADALAYTRWAGCRLPTEAEWEKAARGPDGRRFPWGNGRPTGRVAFDKRLAKLPPAGTCPGDVSPYGCLDLAGSLHEWTSSLFRPYPYRADDGRESLTAPAGAVRVMRGGAFYFPAREAGAAFRTGYLAASANGHQGFRCALSSVPGK